MNFQVYYTSVLWCLVLSQEHQNAYEIYNHQTAPNIQTRRPHSGYIGDIQRNTHGGQAIHFSKHSPLNPDRNKNTISFPKDLTHSEISQRSNTEEPKEDLFFINRGHTGNKPNNEFAFKGSQTYFHESTSTHTDRRTSQGTFTNSFGNRHEISNVDPRKTSQENGNGYFVPNSNNNNGRIDESIDRNHFNKYGSVIRSQPQIEIENNKYQENPASKIKLNGFNFENIHPSFEENSNNGVKIHSNQLGQKAGTTINLENFKIIENSQPVTTITRTVYINGVKVENNNNEGLDSVIYSFLLDSYLNQSKKDNQDHTTNDESRYNPTGGVNVEQNSDNYPKFIFNQLSNKKNKEHHKTNFDNSQNYNKHNDNNANDFNQHPEIDVRFGSLNQMPVQGKLADLREKGRYLKNATNIDGFGNKRAVNQGIKNHFNNQNLHKQDDVKWSGRIKFAEKTENVEVNKQLTNEDRLIFL